ncbi:alpha/beta fold hydrolase [Chitinophaga nivalis]|uniref:Alpha/beta hydrolase n=1 Tax=Chitinophaga nivalis TaxID=2991709 RepID=A0ABT3IQR8_9BACT|nr:alpha/beta hydrolase [Chitinophaga nivalis]MCW3464011.1 alpha/beta hydrolase [Chitinophaga nivalis]MCW3486299.1 alpha/beta hydrolase [Chitinophaga nivalis]
MNTTIFTYSSTPSADGTTIGFQQGGTGPGLIIVPGTLSTSADYTRLAHLLSPSFTVYIIDRRGRGGSGAQGLSYGIRQECEDVQAVQAATGATYIFGHSFGGLVTLETATRYPSFKGIVLYEPGVATEDNPAAWKWISTYEQALQNKQPRRAFTSFVQGAGHTPLSKMPRWFASFVLRMMVRGTHWQETAALLETNLNEHKETQKLRGTYQHYQGITSKVLLLSGDKSPEFVHRTNQILADTIAGSQSQTLPGLSHLSPENKEAPEAIAKEILRILA